MEPQLTLEAEHKEVEVIPGLYLGPYSAAVKSKVEHLQEIGITHIICVRQQMESHFIRPYFPDKFQYLVFDIADSVTTNIIKFLPKVKDFIDGSLTHGGKVLVHGNAGTSRSAALVIGYIMESYCMTFMDAYLLVQNKRFCIKLNAGFEQQLKEYEPIYKANKILQNGQTSQVTGKLKRRYDELEDYDAGSFRMECEHYDPIIL